MTREDRMDIAEMLVMVGGTLGVIGLKSRIKSLVVPSLIAASSATALLTYEVIEAYRMTKMENMYNKAAIFEEKWKEEMKKIKEYLKQSGLGD